MTDDHLSWWDAIRFVWHFRWHPRHAETAVYDESTNVVRCGCGETWGQ
jgi:hypothetical protein